MNTAIKKTSHLGTPIQKLFLKRNTSEALDYSLKKIALPIMEGIDFYNIKNIEHLKAEGNYTSIYLQSGKRVLVCKTLQEIEKLVNDTSFVRIHRSSTINLNLLSKYVRGKGGYVIMESGNNINVSTGKKKDFVEALESYFNIMLH